MPPVRYEYESYTVVVGSFRTVRLGKRCSLTYGILTAYCCTFAFYLDYTHPLPGMHPLALATITTRFDY
jgi:hypothetical protein